MSKISTDTRESLAAVSTDSTSATSQPATPQQLLSFAVDDMEYALPITAVQEISPMLPIESEAPAPAWAEGMVTLRSKTIPFIDLRRVLGNTPVLASDSARIMIVECEKDGRVLIVGLVVDAVSRVLRVPTEKMVGDVVTLETGEIKLVDLSTLL